jgi:alpha-tubulin suppressor-like RCC1 family protein
MSSGQVFAWGRNDGGQLGDNSTTLNASPVQVKLANGSVLGNITQIAAGSDHALALATNGTAFNWGFSGDGTNGLSINSTVNFVTYQTTAVPVFSLPANVAQVAAGMQFSLARMRDGSVFGWGRNDAGQLANGFPGINTGRPLIVKNANGTNLTGVTMIAAGNMHSLALVGALPTTDAISWGNNGWGELGDDTKVSRTSPVAVKNLPAGVLSISAGCGTMGFFTGHHSLALLSDGSVWAWGMNDHGQLGNNSRTNSSLPVQVSGL